MVKRRRAINQLVKPQKTTSIFSSDRLAFSALGWGVLIFFAIVGTLGGAEVVFDLRGVILAFSSVAFTVFAIQKGALESWASIPSALRIILFLLVTYSVAQVIPMPPSLWHQLPGQETRIAVLDTAGLASAWQPITLTPVSSLYSAMMMIAFVTAFLAVLSLPDRSYDSCIVMILAFVVFGILVGIVQISSGGIYPRFYIAADHTALIGLYANKNHMGLAMASSIPLAYYLARKSGRGTSSWQLGFYGYWVVVMLALPLTNSRAGVVFGLVASAATAWPVLATRGWKVKSAAAALFALLAAAIAASPLPQSLLSRFGLMSEDVRWAIYSQSFSLVKPYHIFGSGIGSFRDVFMTIEKLIWIDPQYVNNAHNDYLQIMIEMGLVGALIVIGVFLSVGRAMVKVSASQNSETRRAAWAGFAVLVLFALHSFVDYPLRRPAAVALFVVALGAVFRVYRPQVTRPSVKATFRSHDR